ncbi:biotin--protein ligase [Bombina bombina]|uniref:biotin--protein ligase n=1 Tax=Bombina bombina TaxID=8345 RepID=UPI00235A9F35|nr:biotin--protein ligase [Bombina bombina]
MLFTLCYVYLWLRFRSTYALLIRTSVRRLHRTSSFTFCTELVHSQKQAKVDGGCLKVGSKIFFIEGSKPFEDLNKWSLLAESSCDRDQGAGQITFITESISLPSETLSAASFTSQKIQKLSEYCLPLALCPGDSFKLLAEASVDNFSELGIAFMEDRLQMDNGFLPQKITSVHVNELSLKDKQHVSKEADLNPAVNSGTLLFDHPLFGNSKTSMGVVESTEISEEDTMSNQDNESRVNDEPTTDHRHLHLSSCHECLELENCTIESVRFASAENIPDLPDDLEDSVNHSWLKDNAKSNLTGKPPNVLVYTGSTPGDRFEQIKLVLHHCFDSCRYVVYPLHEEQIHKAPWMDNCLLLVIVAEDPISAEVHKRFLTYLSKGGKILGLSSSFTFGNVIITSKCELNESIQSLIFDEPNSNQTIFDVMASGKVFKKNTNETHDNVASWGYLNNDCKDLMMVHQTYGDNGGEAILCQVHLELSPESLTGHSKETFDVLKKSNSKRFEVLTQIFTSLGLDCDVRTPPSLTPVYLLTSEQDDHSVVLQWLQTRADKDGLIKSNKMSLKLCPVVQPEMVISPSHVPLITGADSISSEDFSLKTYRENLHTEKLGKIVLFAEVTTTTFSLLEGLMFHEPKEMGLIAIAAQQTQGKGRGGNVWLSPKGCALVTLHVSIPLLSNLGQRIAFVQHLMALAVVEAVRSIPGYEDIDLRVKWPNDIYYSDLMKLGGVLVNSTLMGNTFNILIGCGFNVSNSNPTICINDLIMEHNEENHTSIEPLRVDNLIARTVTSLEKLINIFQKDGPNGVLPVYYKYWVHSGKQVRLGSEDGPLAWIVGLDDSGFLQVLQEGKDVITVHPDGNSFDMLRNLIIPKH